MRIKVNRNIALDALASGAVFKPLKSDYSGRYSSACGRWHIDSMRFAWIVTYTLLTGNDVEEVAAQLVVEWSE